MTTLPSPQQENPDLPEDIELGEPELFEHHRIIVDKGQAMLRLDKYLQMRLEGISRTKIQAATKASCVRVNDKPAKSNYKVKPCDVITILLPEPRHEIELLPEPVPFKSVYEDDDVLIVDKEPGLVVHPTSLAPCSTGFYTIFKARRDGMASPSNPIWFTASTRILRGCYSLQRTKRRRPFLPNNSSNTP